MRTRVWLTALTAAAAALFTAPGAAAAPDCNVTTPATSQCERAGNVQIVTGPTTFSETRPFPEYPWGTGGVGGPILGKGGV
jgi:hypothetical protein